MATINILYNINMSGRKTLDFKGKRYTYKNLLELNRKLDFRSVLKTKQLVNDIATGNINKFLKKDDDLIKVDITKKPLLTQPFGIKRIKNRSFYDLAKNPKIKGWDVLTGEQALDTVIGITITIKVRIRFSDEFVIPNNGGIVVWEVELAPSEVEDYIQTEMVDFVAQTYLVEPDQVEVVESSIVSTYTKQPLKIENMRLGKLKQKLTHLFNDVIYDNTGKEGNCIQEYLQAKHPKIWNLDLEGRNKKSNGKKLDFYNSLSTTADVKEYCERNKVRMCAYDIQGNLIAYNYPPRKSKGGVRNCAINFIAYDNHFYPIKNAKLEKCVSKTTEATNIDDLDGKLAELINAGELPKVSVNNSLQLSFIKTKDEKFINNPDLEVCRQLLQDFGLGDQLTDFTNLKNIYLPISQLYLKRKLTSFLPENDRWIKSAYNFTQKNYDVNRLKEFEKLGQLTTLDKKKCYSYALASLEFCITTAIYSNEYKKFNKLKDKIIPSHLYVVKPAFSTILLDTYNIYSGQHLLYCKSKGVEFEIIEYLEGNENPNYYKEFIIDLYDKLVKSGKYTDGEKAFKNIINIMIGKMERGGDKYNNIEITKICGEDELKHTEGYSFPIENTKYFACYEIQQKYDFATRKPIAIQIKDKSRRIIYEMFEKLGLREEEIIQVKTDSFTFIDNRGINFEKYLNTNLDGWKVEDYSPILASVKKLESITFKYSNNEPNFNRLFDCYAGCGKSYYIKEEVKERLAEKDEEDFTEDNYLIISPSWNALKEFLEEGFAAETVQKYTNFNRIPEAKYIYIDEMGLMDAEGWEMVYKMYKMGKVISGFGDFKQLLPAVDKRRFNQPNFINKIFSHKIEMNNNYRNKFTKKYYDKLLDIKQPINWKRFQATKHSVDWREAEKIIAYTNKNVEKYNKMKMDYLGLKKWDIGLKIICVENVLKLSKMDIYNRYEFTILEKDAEKGYKIYEDKWLSEEDLEKYFKPSYCITLYGAQGKSIRGIHFVKEDLRWIDGSAHNYFGYKQDFNSELYTLISRIKKDDVNTKNFIPYTKYYETFNNNFKIKRKNIIRKGTDYIVDLEEE